MVSDVCAANLDEPPDQVPVHSSTGGSEVSVAVPSCLHTHQQTLERTALLGIEN